MSREGEELRKHINQLVRAEEERVRAEEAERELAELWEAVELHKRYMES